MTQVDMLSEKMQGATIALNTQITGVGPEAFIGWISAYSPNLVIK